MKINELEEVVPLFDLYQGLLTEKQKEYFISYYYDDFSLSEIASNFNVSRNAVFDTLKKTEAILKDYEEKLKLYKKKSLRDELYSQLDLNLAKKFKDIEEL